MSEETIKEQTDEQIEETTETSENGTGTENSLESQLEEAKAEASKNLDGWMRAQAEFANAKKRFERDRLMAYTNAKADVMSKLLPILDDFDRAVTNAPEEITSHDWYAGINLVERKLLGLLEQFNVEPLDPVGKPFDPNLHEALSQEPSDEYESDIVTRELQKGYKIGDRVIRPSLVYVAE